eukprot:m.197824 g.197824  ORF g.197824 m.197824 type:complete len:561 (-) comp17029_c0_seq1:2549-4231(-)
MALMARSYLVLWLVTSQVALALDNGLARTPPMGWANWNAFGCNYTSATIRTMADALVSTGMRDVGYDTIIIQECITIAGHRNAQGVPLPDPNKFPEGMKALVDYIHSKGLKAGIYTDVGVETCAGYEGSYNHEAIDAQTYASWGIDFVEEDSCHHPTYANSTLIPYRDLYARMRDALNATKHPFVFYACVQGQDQVQDWGPMTANLWRTTGDICSPGHANWDRMLQNFDGNAQYPTVAGPGGWQDPDMLVVGMNGLSPLEWRSHFSLWSISAAPLWSAPDLSKLDLTTLDIFLNKAVVAVDQDQLGIQGTRRSSWSVPAVPFNITDGTPLQAVDREGQAGNMVTYSKSNGSLVIAGTCFSVENCGQGDGDAIVAFHCVANPSSSSCPANQAFDLIGVGGGVQLRSRWSQKCLELDGRSAALVQQACLNGTKAVGTTQVFQWTSQQQLCLKTHPDTCVGFDLPVAQAGEVWARPLVADRGQAARAAVFFNRDSQASQAITVTMGSLDLDPSQQATIVDLWPAYGDGCLFNGTACVITMSSHSNITAIVQPHGALMVKVVQD